MLATWKNVDWRSKAVPDEVIAKYEARVVSPLEYRASKTLASARVESRFKCHVATWRNVSHVLSQPIGVSCKALGAQGEAQSGLSIQTSIRRDA